MGLVPPESRSAPPDEPDGRPQRVCIVTPRYLLRLAIGTLWVIAGVLQLQPFMFTSAFAEDVLGTASLSQPTPLAELITEIQQLVQALPLAWNWLFAGTELLIGATMLVGRRGGLARLACVASIAWGLSVWLIGEGAGGLFTGHAAFSTGAPGAAGLYAALTVLAWPSELTDGSEAPPARRLVVGTWVGVWSLAALLAVLPAQWGATGLASQSAMGQMMTSSLAVGPNRTLTNWLLDLGPSAAVSLSVAVVLVQLLFALGGLLAGVWGRALVVGGSAYALLCWVFAQGFGGITTGTGTDVGTGPLIALLALMTLTAAPRRVRSAIGEPSGIKRREDWYETLPSLRRSSRPHSRAGRLQLIVQDSHER
jgi:hypothetical protein